MIHQIAARSVQRIDVTSRTLSSSIVSAAESLMLPNRRRASGRLIPHSFLPGSIPTTMSHRTLSNILFIALACSYLTQVADAHMRWVFPIPRSNLPNVTNGPCGPESFGSGQITHMAPGPTLLKWESTILHPGSPFRIALSGGSDNNYEEHILYDHIPFNDQGVLNPTLGFSVLADIPDVDCPHCALQILHPRTDNLPPDWRQCEYSPSKAVSSACIRVYYSCADVSISGSTPFASWKSVEIDPCPYHVGENATWMFVNGTTWTLPSPISRSPCHTDSNPDHGDASVGAAAATATVSGIVLLGGTFCCCWRRRRRGTARLENDDDDGDAAGQGVELEAAQDLGQKSARGPAGGDLDGAAAGIKSPLRESREKKTTKGRRRPRDLDMTPANPFISTPYAMDEDEFSPSSFSLASRSVTVHTTAPGDTPRSINAAPSSSSSSSSKAGRRPKPQDRFRAGPSSEFSKEIARSFMRSDPTSPRLPEGWTEHVTPEGHVYFYNDLTDQTQWERPSN